MQMLLTHIYHTAHRTFDV